MKLDYKNLCNDMIMSFLKFQFGPWSNLVFKYITSPNFWKLDESIATII